MSDFSFSVSTDGLQDKGSILSEEATNIKNALEDVNSARAALDAWISQNKDKYDAKVANGVPKLMEMADNVMSFGNVAKDTSSRLVNVENKIAAAIDNDDIAA